jgi:serine phosphatase RsbU (regulator of sigma subunit)
MQVAIPLLSGANRIGVVRIGENEEHRPYDEATLSILQTLSLHASMAIENSTLLAQMARTQRVEQEMLLARQIQMTMLPRTRPEVPGYEVCAASYPAHEVGGDYFDYVSASEACWHLLVGDVSGKGVPAAMIMSIVRSLFHPYAEFETSPRSILSRVNRSLSQDLDPDMFVTLASLRLDPRQDTVRVARAGHEPVLIMRNSGAIEHIAPSGAAMGLLDIQSFDQMIEETQFRLQTHDTLLLYTDGITEAQNSAQDEFGYDRLEEVVRAHAGLPADGLVEKILAEVKGFTDGTPQNDDITLMVVRKNGVEAH